MLKTAIFLTLFINFYCFSQSNFLIENIPSDLKENANSIIVLEKVNIKITSNKNLIRNHQRIITVLNKNGNRDVNTYVDYDKNTKVKKLKAVVYDDNGEEIENYRKKDFLDLSAVDGGTLYSDNRVYYLNYRPDKYPYTVVFNYETETSDTAFISPWYPNIGYFSSILESKIEIIFHPELSFKFKKYDVDSVINIEEKPGFISFSTSNLKAIEPEDNSPSFENFAPHVLFSLNEFYLAGVKGYSKNWNQFGDWMNTQLLNGISDLPIDTKNKIIDLVKDEPNTLGKARKIYQYVQDNTRYISVQIGIGGWKPMPASFVDNLGYGDCKALTNYTKALMDVVGIPSYYTVLYAGNHKRNIQSDFSSLQGNHVILAIQNEDDYIWLECTNQKIPFGFIGGFTDDRDVLMITPEGGRIEHTLVYNPEKNVLNTKGTCKLNINGALTANVILESSGVQYGQRYELATMDFEKQVDYYKDYWNYIDNVSIDSLVITNDRSQIKLTENVVFNASSYVSFINDDMIVPINMLNRSTYVPDKYKDRKQPLKINRGFVDNDEVVIILPKGYSVSSIPEPVKLETAFGSYSSSLELDSENNIKYLRHLRLVNGDFPKEDFKKYRAFRKKISKYDNQKILLIKN